MILGLWAAASNSESDDDSSPWKNNEWQGSCESCDSGNIVHLVDEDELPEWVDRTTAPSWVEFSWDLDNRRCEDCGHKWTEN